MFVEIDTRGMTPFQAKHVEDVRSSDNFEKFIGMHMSEEEYAAMERPAGPRRVMYRTKDGHLHIDLMGCDEMQHRIDSGKECTTIDGKVADLPKP